jgi:hypothetical protein
LYDTLEPGCCRFVTIILATSLSPVFANKLRDDWSKNHQVTFILFRIQVLNLPYPKPIYGLLASRIHYQQFLMLFANQFPKQNLFDDEAEEDDADDDIDDRGDVESSIDSEM